MSRLQDLDFNNIEFSKTKFKNSKNKFLYVYYDKKPVVLKFPKMRLPFGINADTLSNKKQYIVDMSFEDYPELMSKVEEMDKVIIGKVHEEFFQDKTLDEVKIMFTSCIKYPNNPQYSPTFRSKIITDKDEQIKCDFYKNEKNEEGKYPKINIKEEGDEQYLNIAMKKNSHIEGILECIGLWIMGDKFGLSYKLSQVKLYPKVEEKEQVNCEFIESDDSSNSDVDFLGE